MKNLKLAKIFIVSMVYLSIGWPVYVFSANNECPKLSYLASEYIESHKEEILKKCMNNGSVDNSCRNVAQAAYDKFKNCFDDCGGNNPSVYDAKCGSINKATCDYYVCQNKIDNDCALKCKDFLSFEFNSLSEKNNTNNKKEDIAIQNKLIGLPVDSKINAVPCIGETPKNSEVCPKDDEKVFYYTEKELVGYCSVPEGSEPKCEYVCKSGYNFVDGDCESAGFFTRIISWLVNLF